MTGLLVAPCDTRAATFAVMRWHYSGRMPVSKKACYGAWHDGQFVGAVVFAWGANRNAFAEFGLAQEQAAELVRVALRSDHAAPVSQVVARAVKLLHEGSPGLRMLLSYADPYEGHHGGIYQALNWLYLGPSGVTKPWELPSGRVVHNRTLTGRAFGGQQRQPPRLAVRTARPPKHRYVWPLDRAMRRQLAPLAREYPSAVEVSTVRHPRPPRGVRVRLPPTAP